MIDNIINTMDNLKEAAESIGDSYIVAAEDLEELGDAYPGILENAQLLTDGTMKLNQESVKSSMAAAQKEVELSKQEVVEKLRNQQAELEGKQAAAQKIAEIYGVPLEEVNSTTNTTVENIFGKL